MNETNQGTWTVCTNAAVRRASRQLGQLYDDVMAPSGLRMTQFTLLTQILYGNAPSLRMLADAMVMDLSALGHTLKPLIRDGLVELVPDEADRRVKRVQLTASGSDKRNQCQALWADAQARFDRAFGAQESAAIRAALARISSKEFAADFTRDAS